MHQLVAGILKDHLVSSLSLPPFLIIKDQEVWLRLSISHAPPSLQLMTVSEISIIYNCIIVLIVTWKTNEYTQVCNPPQTPPSFDKQLKKKTQQNILKHTREKQTCMKRDYTLKYCRCGQLKKHMHKEEHENIKKTTMADSLIQAWTRTFEYCS